MWPSLMALEFCFLTMRSWLALLLSKRGFRRSSPPIHASKGTREIKNMMAHCYTFYFDIAFGVVVVVVVANSNNGLHFRFV